MIKAILIDDEPLARSLVREYLQSYPQISVIDECNDGFEGIKSILQHKPEIIFLDVQMPKINGFEMLELVDTRPAVIFTTAFDEYAIRAFESHAVDYLLKPFSKERFDKALEKFLNNHHTASKEVSELIESSSASPQQSQRVVVKDGGKIRIIPVPDIYYFEAADDYVKLHSKDGLFLKNKTMTWFEKALDNNHFIRTHRSYIINIHYISRLELYEKEGYLAILKNGQQVPVSKTGYGRLKLALGI